LAKIYIQFVKIYKVRLYGLVTLVCVSAYNTGPEAHIYLGF